MFQQPFIVLATAAALRSRAIGLNMMADGIREIEKRR